MKSEPLVSILISAYNAGCFLQESINSIINQTYKNLEIILIDDGSTDNSVERLDVEDSRLNIIKQCNSGKAAALNRALKMIKGQYYAIHDADDISAIDRIERQVEFFNENEQVAAVFCGHDLMLNERRMAPQCHVKDASQCKQDIENFRMPAHDPTVMYRTKKVRNMQYNEDLRVGQGFDYILRVGEKHSMYVLGECLYTYRIHSASITKKSLETRTRCIKEVLKQACARRSILYEKRFSHLDDQLNRRRSNDYDNNLPAHFIQSTLDSKARRRYVLAIQTGVQCLKLHPFESHYWKAFAYAVLPVSLLTFLQRCIKNK